MIQQVADAARSRGVALGIVAPDAEQTNRTQAGVPDGCHQCTGVADARVEDMLAAIER